jgi:hypothetical protein
MNGWQALSTHAPVRHEWPHAPQFAGSEVMSAVQVDPEEEAEADDAALLAEDAALDVAALADDEPPEASKVRVVGLHDAAHTTQPVESNSVRSAREDCIRRG